MVCASLVVGRDPAGPEDAIKDCPVAVVGDQHWAAQLRA
jgi:hypothetical protein